MSNYVKLAEETGDRYLAALEQSQENYLKYVAAVNQWTPRQAGPFAGMSALLAVANAGFEFSERYLKQQKAFSDLLFGQTATARARTSTKAVRARRAPAAKAPVVRSSKEQASPRSKSAPADKS